MLRKPFVQKDHKPKPLKGQHAAAAALASVMSNSAITWTIGHQAPFTRGFSRQECWSGVPCPPSGDLPHPGIEHVSPEAPVLHADSLLPSHQGNVHVC